MDIGDCKKRVVDRRSPENRRASAPDTFVSPSPNRRVKGRRDSGSWAESGGLDDVTAALPETLDLSGQADLSTEALRVLLLEHPRTCILKLDGCMVSIPAHPCMHCCQQDSRIAASKTPLMKCCQQGSLSVESESHFVRHDFHTLCSFPSSVFFCAAPDRASWQGLGDDAIACICSIVGEHITELSLVGCTQVFLLNNYEPVFKEIAY